MRQPPKFDKRRLENELTLFRAWRHAAGMYCVMCGRRWRFFRWLNWRKADNWAVLLERPGVEALLVTCGSRCREKTLNALHPKHSMTNRNRKGFNAMHGGRCRVCMLSPYESMLIAKNTGDRFDGFIQTKTGLSACGYDCLAVMDGSEPMRGADLRLAIELIGKQANLKNLGKLSIVSSAFAY